MSTLIIDEGLGSLDATGKQHFVNLIHSLRGIFSRIVIITHTDVSEMFDSGVVRVEKQNEVSKIIQSV